MIKIVAADFEKYLISKIRILLVIPGFALPNLMKIVQIVWSVKYTRYTDIIKISNIKNNNKNSFGFFPMGSEN